MQITLRNHLQVAITQGLGKAEPLMWKFIMSASKTVVLGLAAILFSAVSAQAATHAKAAPHKAMHAMSHKSSTGSGPDNSADSLNAQSLTRAQSPQ